MQLFILGMHRSGTSALARLLNLMGLYFGGENVSTGRNTENEKGFWERRDVRQLNDAILFKTAADWDAVSTLDISALSSSERAGYASAAADIVMNLDAHRPWFVKEPRLCLLFPIWRDALETPVCIHIHRNPLEVAQSLRKRNDIPIPVGLALWETYNIGALQASQGLPRHILSYEQLLQKPTPVLESIHAFLTRHGNYDLRQPGDQELSAFLNPDLQRQRATEREFAEAATSSQVALYEFLAGTSSTKPPDGPPPGCLETLAEYEATVDLADRRNRAQLSEEQRGADNLELQLALKNVEAKHFRESRDEAAVRSIAVERKVEKLQDVRRELSVQLAVSEQRAKTLQKDQGTARARFSAELDGLRRELSAQHAVNGERTRTLLISEQRVETLQKDQETARARFSAELDGLRRELSAQHAVNGERARTLQISEQRVETLQKDQETARARFSAELDGLRRELSAQHAVNGERARTLQISEQRVETLQKDQETARARFSAELDGLRRELSAQHAVNGERARTLQISEQRVETLQKDQETARARFSAELAALRRELSAQHAVSEQRARTLQISEQRVETLQKDQETARARFSAELDGLRRELSAQHAVSEQRARTLQISEQRVETLQKDQETARARFSAELDGLRRVRKELEAQRDALRDYKQSSSVAASEHRAEATRATRRWDAEIARHQVQIAELDDFNSQLTSCIVDWLGSRRWRLGDALVTLPHRLLFRRTPKNAFDQLHEAANGHEARLATSHQTATSHARLLADLPTSSTGAAKVDDQAVLADATRATVLTRMLFERSSALARNTAGIAVRRRFGADLTALADTLLRSRRWRLGHLLLSLPRLVVGKGRPLTVADAILALIREHELDADAARIIQPAEPPGEPQVLEKRPAPRPREAATATQNLPVAQPPSAPLYPPAVTGDVDVVVCVHNALEHVQQCLSSVVARTTVDYRLIVVNDGSDATTTDWLREFAAKQAGVELIETNGPLGYTCAANQGLRATSATNVVLLNSDTVVPRLWLEEMLECMASDDSVGIVGPLSNAASWQSVPERVGPDGRWAVNDLPAGYNVDEFAELVWLVSRRQFPRADFINGFCFMINRQVIDRVGFLDEENFPRGYGEENDYCLRAKDAGFELAIADHCLVYHAKSKSFGDAARTRLAKAGAEALQRKHGTARIEQGTERLKTSPVLADIRERVNFHLRGETAQSAASQPPDHSPTGNHVLFVLPVRGGSGGANSVVQEVVGMRSLGVDAKVATHAKYKDAFSRFYPEFLKGGNHFIFYDSDDDLVARAAPFQIIVATLWSTPALIAPIAVRCPEKLYVYYVQDYEPWFFPDDDASRRIALNSYSIVPNMVFMAKTDWICRTVKEHHGRDVYRVAASLDHDVYYPNLSPKSDEDPVYIAAMIRPTTPRRGPLRTVRVLKEVSATLGDSVRMLLFGCEAQNLRTYIERNAPELRLDSCFENRGILHRVGVAELLREADIFVDLSDYQAFGRTGLEAMACGCAVVLPCKGGVYEYAIDGLNCVTVDTSQYHSMTAKLVQLAADPSLRASLANQGTETAQNFDIRRASLSELSVFRFACAVSEATDSQNERYRRRLAAPSSSLVTPHSQ